MPMHLHEFLYRGQPEGSDQAPGYHVVLATVVEDPFGGTALTTFPPMTPEQAEKAGFPLPKIVKAINGSLMAENAALKARIADLEAPVSPRGAADEASRSEPSGSVEDTREGSPAS